VEGLAGNTLFPCISFDAVLDFGSPQKVINALKLNHLTQTVNADDAS
jgi:hypothetical protein